jgi:Transposase IS4
VELISENLAESLPSKQREIPPYTPPLGYIEYKAGSRVSKATDELSTFLLLFSEDYIKLIIAVTNSYAERDQNDLSYDFSRKWTPMSRADLLHFIGCLFYMGMYRETLRDDY